MIGELCCQTRMRRLGLGGDHDARSFLVESVDNTGTSHAANALKAVAAMVQQRIDQRAAPIAWCGMHHHAGRFVDDHEIGVLM